MGWEFRTTSKLGLAFQIMIHSSKQMWVTYFINLDGNDNFPICCRFRRGHRELLNGRLCSPDSEQWLWSSNLCTIAIVKLCWHNFTQSAYFMIFFVSSISYRPTDLSLLKEFSKNVSFWKFYIFHQIFPNRGLWLAILLLWL